MEPYKLEILYYGPDINILMYMQEMANGMMPEDKEVL